MKRFILIAMAIVLVGTAAVVLANPSWNPDTISASGYTLVTTSEYIDGSWVPVDKYNEARRAATYTSLGASGSCDKLTWTATIENAASVAQWINWSFSDSRWDWQVRKPGTYAADCITFQLQSNNDVTMTFAGFEPLANVAGYSSLIPAWYGFGDAISDVESGVLGGWMAAKGTSQDADNINNLSLVFPYENIKNSRNYKFWTKIQVDPSTHSCEYYDSGVITLTLKEIKFWINSEDGNFWNCNDAGYSCSPAHFLAPNGGYYFY
jgi:hypothetical protein